MVFDRRETLTLLIGDFLILALSLGVALTLRNLSFPTYGYFVDNFVPFLPMFILSLAVFYIAGLYEKQTRPIRRVMGVRILGAQATTVAIAAILFFILPFSIAPKTILVLYLVISVVAESAWRFYRMSRELATEERVPALLVGSGPTVLELFEEVRENPRYLMHFTEHLESTGRAKGEVAKLVSEAIEKGARAVVLDLSDERIAADLPALYDLMADGVMFLEFAALYEEIFDRVPLGHLDPARLVESLPKRRAVYDAVKRLFDVVFALVGMVIAAPFIILAAAASSVQGGSPFIRQERVGKGGQVFLLIKLRSKLFDDKGDPELYAKNRVTALGKFLRKTRIDELPQFLNVLKGDISFIGPRPEVPNIVRHCEEVIPQYGLRHLIMPGLSGWAQIHDYCGEVAPCAARFLWNMIIDGRAIAREILEETKTEASHLLVPPSFLAVAVAPSPATESYLKMKRQQASEVGIRMEVKIYQHATTEELVSMLAQVEEDAVIVQLPLPDTIDLHVVLDAIPPEKDADVLAARTREQQLLMHPVAAAIQENTVTNPGSWMRSIPMY